jgi:hypothetical protein
MVSIVYYWVFCELAELLRGAKSLMPPEGPAG